MKTTLATTVEEVRDRVTRARQDGARVGLVPTMGALHEGHISLIRAARNECDFVVTSIFVNPTQFGPNEDLDRYPRDLEGDMEICNRERVDLVFAPTAEEMYPPGFCTYVEVHGLQEVLCGKSRPTHFRGVATVVLKLFNIVQPEVAYFGQKDAQQARLIQQMVRDLDVPVAIRVCPIVREPDGLALSSRNQYLNASQRQQALVLSQSLEAAVAAIAKGERDPDRIESLMRDVIARAPEARIDYASVVDFDTLRRPDRLQGQTLLAVAVYIGDTRLIDNALVDIDPVQRKTTA